MSDYCEHQILNITSQSLKLNEKYLMMQYYLIVHLRHQYKLYVAQVLADLATTFMLKYAFQDF